MKITKDMKIEEVLKKYPQTREVFEEYGFHCLDCMAARFETIEEGAVVHGIDVDKFLKDINKKISEE